MAKNEKQKQATYPDGRLVPPPPQTRWESIAQAEGAAARAITAERNAWEASENARFRSELDAAVKGPLVTPGPAPRISWEIHNRDAASRREAALNKKGLDRDESDDD